MSKKVKTSEWQKKTGRIGINILQEDYALIKQFCDARCLRMSLWISNTLRNEVEKQTRA